MDLPDLKSADTSNVPELLAWITEVTGVAAPRVTRPQPMGRSRDIWLVDGIYPDGRPLSAVVRHEVGHGPWSNTAFTLGREATVLRALAKTDIPVPEVIACSKDGMCLLIGCLPGSAEFDFTDDALKSLTIDNWIAKLVALHSLDPDTLDTPIPRPKTAEEHALLDLSDYRRSYETLCDRHPEVDACFEWLFANAPTDAARTSLLQGDTGPGNFMHLDGAITGIIDWEAAHFGDPMDDLAWLWFRKCFLRADADLADWFDRYERCAGRPVDIAKVAYYRVAVLARVAVAVLVRQAHDPAHDDTEPKMLVALLRMLMRDPLSSTGRPDALPHLMAGPLSMDILKG